MKSHTPPKERTKDQLSMLNTNRQQTTVGFTAMFGGSRVSNKIKYGSHKNRNAKNENKKRRKEEKID